MLESNYLGMLVKPNFEKPMDSAKDVLDRGITILWFPEYEWYKEDAIKQNESLIKKKLAEQVYVSKVSNNCYHKLNIILNIIFQFEGLGRLRTEVQRLDTRRKFGHY